MKILVHVIYLISFSLSLAYADANWPNEPVGSTVLLDCGFDTPTCGGQLSDPYRTAGGSLTVQSDRNAPLSPFNVLRSTGSYITGSGGTELHYYAPKRITEIYVGFWWKTNLEFTGNQANANKTFFVRGTTGGQNGVFYLRSNPALPKVLFWSTQLANNLDQCRGAPDQDHCYPNVNTTSIVPGTWYRIEVYMKASSCSTCRDGAVRWWINGVLNGNYSNFAYGPLVDEWVWSETWDGQGNGKGFTSDPSHFLDHIRISAPNGGNIPVPMPQPQPAPAPAPAPAPMPSVGTVNDLAVASTTSSSVNLSFTEVSDGSGAPAKYDLRVGAPGSHWGAMNSVSVGSCATPIAGSQVGAKKTCEISGLQPSTQYQFQVVAFRGVMNQGASYGGFSSAVSATTHAVSPSPAPVPAPAPMPAPQPAPAPAPAPAPNPGNPSPADSLAPQAAFIYPTSGATLAGSVLFLAQASDNVGVTDLRFYLNGVQLGPELKQSPYVMIVDTSRIQDGNHELSIVAKDAAGNISVPSKMRINVLNSRASDPAMGVAGCMQTSSNQVNASMGLIWVLPIIGLMRRRKDK